jgi:tetratricopeptide (TPR) repeat protein
VGEPQVSADYSRSQVRRILKIRENRLRSFERHGLYEPLLKFGFSDLIALNALKRLREDRISPGRIKDSLSALAQTLPEIKQPLRELKFIPSGRRITVELPNGRMEALTGQLLLDFEGPGRKPSNTVSHSDGLSFAARLRDAERWFRRGLELEEQAAEDESAMEAYYRALELNPGAAGAWVNIGTLHYRRAELENAERNYREALRISPNYPLAHFNLGNICEELGRLDEAINHYKIALQLQPTYADSHYNLALVYERQREPMRAVRHWREYLHLDSASPWARIAREQLKSLLQVTQGGRPSNPPA